MFQENTKFATKYEEHSAIVREMNTDAQAIKVQQIHLLQCYEEYIAELKRLHSEVLFEVLSKLPPPTLQ